MHVDEAFLSNTNYCYYFYSAHHFTWLNNLMIWHYLSRRVHQASFLLNVFRKSIITALNRWTFRYSLNLNETWFFTVWSIWCKSVEFFQRKSVPPLGKGRRKLLLFSITRSLIRCPLKISVIYILKKVFKPQFSPLNSVRSVCPNDLPNHLLYNILTNIF